MADREQVVLNGRYELHRRVGRGGMAEVYLARDRLLDRLVAIKILFPEFATDPSFVARFRREAQAAANLNHPNIVGVYDWGKERGTYYIVMEYVDGRTVSEIIRNDGPIEAKRAAGIAADVAAALNFAHRKGVVHRDVKPGNVLITKAGEVKVADFGIARAMSSKGEDDLTQTGSVMGTATYFSPEQAQGKAVDPRSDLYSLGVVLYEMVAGKPPFSGENPVSIAYQHVQEPIPPLAERAPGVPRPYVAITMRALAKDPADRYPDGAAMRADLLRFREGKAPAVAAAGPPRPPTKPSPVAAPVEAAASTAAAAPERQDGARRTGWFFVIIVLLLAILAGLLFAFGQQLGIFDEQTASVTVPDVVGTDIDLARQTLTDAGFEVETQDRESDEDPGQVLEQSPSAGDQADEGSTVVLTISSGVGTAELPDLANQTEGDARNALRALGFTDVVTENVEDDTVDPGTVLRTDPGPGTYAKDQRIVLFVAIAAPTTTTAPTTTAPPTTTTTAPPTTTTTSTTTTTTSTTTTSTTTTSTTTTTTTP